jgi:hypothetical protein
MVVAPEAARVAVLRRIAPVRRTDREQAVG